MIEDLRREFNARFTDAGYRKLLSRLELSCGARIDFRVAETPVFLTTAMLDGMVEAGRALTEHLLGWPEYLAAAEASIPAGYCVAGASAHPNFLTADFALVRAADGSLEPKLVELQAFPSVFGYQAVLAEEYRRVYGLSENLEIFPCGLTEEGYWRLLHETIVGKHDPEQVVLTEVEPERQKTFPDFLVTARRLGIRVVDIAKLEPQGRKLTYRDEQGRRVEIRRIYNRAIADEMMAKRLRLDFDLEAEWDVEWSGHPNWYFRVSKFALPWLSGTVTSGTVAGSRMPAHEVVPPAVFLDDFLDGTGLEALQRAAVPKRRAAGAVYEHLLLKPLFSFAGKGIIFTPSHEELLAIPADERRGYLVQQRMRFEPTIETPHGLTQAEVRILYAWPDGGRLTAAISLVRLGRGRMMGVDHNREMAWVGASAAFAVAESA